MVNNNNNIPPVEEIREIKNEIPSFEEFMQSYGYDSNLNYDDLNSGSIGEAKGYGPNPKNDYKGKKKKSKSNETDGYDGQHLINTLNNK